MPQRGGQGRVQAEIECNRSGMLWRSWAKAQSVHLNSKEQEFGRLHGVLILGAHKRKALRGEGDY